MNTESDAERVDKFLKHLDECAQCKNHPFELCWLGALLLKYAATEEIGRNENRTSS